MNQTQIINQQSYYRGEWKRGYDSQPNEYEYEIENIEGKIPPRTSRNIIP